MAALPRFLTKSRFKIGCECPSKLFYADDVSYGSNFKDNSFLEALAEGGFQVGELAKLYFPGGTEIGGSDKEKAAATTAELLKKDKVIIYEAAFLFQNLFVKADIVVKNGASLELIEVKAKSFDATSNSFYTKTSIKKGIPKISSDWEPYLLDITFQAFVARKAFPKFTIHPFLMLADKTCKATVDGLNQMFLLVKDQGSRTKVKVNPSATPDNLGKKILKKINVSTEVSLIETMKFEGGRTFLDTIQTLSKICSENIFAKPRLDSKCKGCEFRIPETEIEKGLKSGFRHCWKAEAKLKDSDFKRPFVFDIWNFRKAATLLETGTFFMDQLDESDISPKESDRGMSSSERQWMQVLKVKNKDDSVEIDRDGLSYEISKWKYPLHFIDFETTMVAIPFNKGRRPYEQIAFQFSHHILRENGTIIHADEYLNLEKGKFPNFDFVRKLKDALSKDDGTIFRYAAHENTVLCQVRQQILNSDEKIEDKKELLDFISQITKSSEDSLEQWEGSRNMVDLCELVKRYCFHPATNGSNSIKKVLPAILKDSAYLKKKYAASIYGSHEIKSKNFKDWKWIELDSSGQVIDPYKRLPPIFGDLDLETMDSLITDNSIADGGAAMTAYARMQFTEMAKEECDQVGKALLKYCELDTFAMVMLFEYWREQLSASETKEGAA